MQDFDPELLPIGGSHSQVVKGPPIGNDSGSKDCVNLPSPTAVSRLKETQAIFRFRAPFSVGLIIFNALEPRVIFEMLTPIFLAISR